MATRKTSSRVVSPKKALATPSWNMVFMPPAIASARMAEVSCRSMIMLRILRPIRLGYHAAKGHRAKSDLRNLQSCLS